MNNTAIVYPGTFDPLTNGHLDIITRATKIFNPVIVAVAENTVKQTVFSFTERVSMTAEALQSMPTVQVCGFKQLLIDFLDEKNIFLILRGIRNVSDLDYERQLFLINKALSRTQLIDTVFMPAQEKYLHISSSFIKNIAELGGNIATFVPPVVENLFLAKIKTQNKPQEKA